MSKVDFQSNGSLETNLVYHYNYLLFMVSVR